MKNLGRRVVLFPLPLQGHVSPMLQLASVLHSKGFSITIIHTRYNSLDPANFPDFTIKIIEEGLSDIALSSVFISELNKCCLEPLRACLSRILSQESAVQEPVACLITDSLWQITREVACGLNLPRLTLRTTSVSAFFVYDAIDLLRQNGYFPVQEHKLDEPVVELPPLKLKDIPSEKHYDQLTAIAEETKSCQAIIFNTFEELESTALAKIRQDLPHPIFAIGPLHKSSKAVASSILAHDHTCLSWLDTQKSKSVLYVSFGTVAAMSQAEFVELAWGLAYSMQPFLWAIRPGMVQGFAENDPLPEGYLNEISSRGHIVKWAPQKEVLAHPAIGGFWTHTGWNSTLESVCEGVPMICSPFYTDQPVNARHVTDSWKTGLRLEGGLKRDEIQRAIKRLMTEEEGKEMRRRITTLRDKASRCLMEGGSSYESLERLTGYILSL